MDSTFLSGMDNVFVLRFPIVVYKEMLVDDGIDIGVMWGFHRGTDEARFMLFSVNRKGTEKFLGLIEGCFDGEGPFDLVDHGFDFFQPRES